MKKMIFSLIMLTISMFISGCQDDVDLENQENTVEYTIKTDTPTAQIHVNATGLDAQGVYFKGEFTNKCVTKDYFVVVNATCDDAYVMIDVEVSVNGKQIASSKGNQCVFVSERIKGKGPYLE